jgi:hypothetical protein
MSFITFRRVVAFAIAASALAIPTAAFADGSKPAQSTYTESKNDKGQVVAFTDDPLDGTGVAGTFPLIGTPNGRAHRANLLRPRTTFVNELTKTVESL